MKAPCFLLLALLGAHSIAAEPAEDALWQQLRGAGVTVLMRHAATDPGIGDPPGFALGQCATQRNLSDRGRRDARAIGDAFRRHGVHPGAVWSSRWCRCLDTARLAFGRAEPEPGLDSMFSDDASDSAAKLDALRARLAGRRATAPLVLVTHDVNVRTLTGRSLAPGEMLLTILRNGKLEPIGRLAVPPGAQAAR
jgi:broad specificity phosphatase PhoE